MKVLVIGGVAAGTKAAAKCMREDRSAEVTIITKGEDISYAGCGLPYYVGGLIGSREELIVNTPKKYEGLTGVTVHTGVEAEQIDFAGKKVQAKKVSTGETVEYGYDRLIIATGASPIVPPIPGAGLPGVFKMRTPDDAIELRNYIQENHCKKAVVVGGGFIGLEIAENVKAQGLMVTVVDLAPQILPGILDPEMADFAKKQLKKSGISVHTGVKVEAVEGTEKAAGVKTDAGAFGADVVVMSVGIRPNTAFLKDSGLVMERGTIVVDGKMATNVPDVYAAGDCCMVKNRLTGAPQWSPMGSTANYAGRTLAQVLNGKDKEYAGCLGTGVVKLPGINAGKTGLTEGQAKAAGYDAETVLAVVDDKAHYYPGADSFIIKLVADKDSHRVLGVQVLGAGAVDKIVDIAVTGISLGAKVEDFENMDMAYAPPFSTAIHPFVQICYIMENKLAGAFETITPAAYLAGAAKGYQVLDVMPEAKIPGARWVNLSKVNGPIEGIEKDAKLLLVCAKGKRGYFLQNRLKAYGYTNTRVLEGGITFNEVKVEGAKSTVSAEDVKRVKALGCLQDKNHPDRFNVRVITRNGKITAKEQQCIAEAAEKYGTGEVTMTTRLTLEIQGVPYEKIEEVREYLMREGLETGGTGSKVRPVVSCKGTTCQYGLIDTFALSEEIHERFYKGFNDVKLPHKFKIAVGGCPNNCVKPDLNDLGVVGQRVPVVDESLCKGCKVCQVENNCPLKDAKVEEVNGERKLKIDKTLCNHCGRCIGKCPFGAVKEAETGYRIYIGGRWGKKIAHGKALDKIFTDKEEVLQAIEKAILFFRDEGITGERFADTIDRLGFEYVQDKLMSDELLARKDEVIKAQKHLVGGATC